MTTKKPKAKVKEVTISLKKEVGPGPNVFSSVRPQKMGASPAGWHSIEDKWLCDKRHQLSKVWKIRQPAVMTPDPLGVGGLFHQGRAHWFMSGFAMGADYQSTLHDFVREAALQYDLPVRDEAINRAISYLDQYCTYWSARVKPQVIAVEYDLKHAVLPGYDDRTARVDDISKYPEHGFKVCIGECKTTSVSVADVVNEYTVHGQTLLQDLLWEASSMGAQKHGPIEAVLMDVIVKGYGKEKCQFGRVPIRITDYMKNWFLQDLGRHVAEARDMTIETKAQRRITSCTRLIGRMRVPCPYRDLCQRGKPAAVGYVDETGTNLLSKKYDTKARPWD